MLVWARWSLMHDSVMFAPFHFTHPFSSVVPNKYLVRHIIIVTQKIIADAIELGRSCSSAI